MAKINDGANNGSDLVLSSCDFLLGPFLRSLRFRFPEISSRPEPIICSFALEDIYTARDCLLSDLSVAAMVRQNKRRSEAAQAPDNAFFDFPPYSTRSAPFLV